uniref:uncharacterized protein LOC129505879 n=1 Tax=Nyctereutes procyonoides TaxID=34880 RepID=UPI0024442C3F|nr:uncharacterized protein LOC129505879 [Nyctereutes procyonoides]
MPEQAVGQQGFAKDTGRLGYGAGKELCKLHGRETCVKWEEARRELQVDKKDSLKPCPDAQVAVGESPTAQTVTLRGFRSLVTSEDTCHRSTWASGLRTTLLSWPLHSLGRGGALLQEETRDGATGWGEWEETAASSPGSHAAGRGASGRSPSASPHPSRRTFSPASRAATQGDLTGHTTGACRECASFLDAANSWGEESEAVVLVSDRYATLYELRALDSYNSILTYLCVTRSTATRDHDLPVGHIISQGLQGTAKRQLEFSSTHCSIL